MTALFARWWRRVRYLVAGDRAEREMREEMELHLQYDIEDRIRRGAPPDEARRAALLVFGGVERFKEEGRDARGVKVLYDGWRDLRYTTRTLRKSWSFATVTATIVALGVAGTVIVVSAVQYLVVAPLPVADPDNLVVITERWRNNGYFNSTNGYWVYPYHHYRDLRDATGDHFTDVAAFRPDAFSFRTGDTVRRLNGVVTSPNYFGVLGVPLAMGRGYANAGDAGEYRAVVSHALWQTVFEGRSDILDQTLFLDGRAHRVVGVAPAGFHGTMPLLRAGVWIPAATYETPPWVAMVGRLRMDAPRERAAGALATIVQRLPGIPNGGEIRRVELDRLRGVPAMMRGYTIGFAGLLGVTAGLVVLVGIVNVSGLVFARTTHRQQEIGVRMALGASRGRVVRQLVLEGVTVCAGGAALGAFVAWWLLGSLAPSVVPPVFGVTIAFPVNALTLGSGIAVAVGLGVLSSLAPALRGTRLDLGSALRGRDAGRPRRFGVARIGVVVGQLTVSLLLLLVTGVFIRALRSGLDVDPGFVADDVAIASIHLAPHGYDTGRAWALVTAVVEELRGRADIDGVTVGRWMPLTGNTHGGSVHPEPSPADARPITIYYGAVDPSFFETMRTSIVMGRALTDLDGRTGARVVVVNETLGRRLAGDGSALGQRFRLEGEMWEVVGVAQDGKYVTLDEAPRPYLYRPFEEPHASSVTFFVRSPAGAETALRSLRNAVQATDPNVALELPGAFTDRLATFLLPQRVAAWFIGGFGLIGLGLAAIGIYGTVAYQVAQRTREFGIRIALGAGRRDIIRHVVRHTALATALAIVVGAGFAVVGSIYASAALANRFLYAAGVDLPTLLTAGLFLAMVAILAAYIPARRAARVDPMRTIRIEG